MPKRYFVPLLAALAAGLLATAAPGVTAKPRGRDCDNKKVYSWIWVDRVTNATCSRGAKITKLWADWTGYTPGIDGWRMPDGYSKKIRSFKCTYRKRPGHDRLTCKAADGRKIDSRLDP